MANRSTSSWKCAHPATVNDATVAANAGNGVLGDETGAGSGTVTVTGLRGEGNALGQTGGGATFLP